LIPEEFKDSDNNNEITSYVSDKIKLNKLVVLDICRDIDMSFTTKIDGFGVVGVTQFPSCNTYTISRGGGSLLC
jgi:hypothetical protein